MPADQLPLFLPLDQLPPTHIEWLRIANAGSYYAKDYLFYPIKRTLLHRYATSDGFDIQKIVKPCWCGDGIYRGPDEGPPMPARFWQRCNKCNGSGIYSRKTIVLKRWKIGDITFHEPLPEVPWQSITKTNPGSIEGIIKHRPVDTKVAIRCCLRLLLRYQPKKWLAYQTNRLITPRLHRIRYKLRMAFQRRGQLDDIPF